MSNELAMFEHAMEIEIAAPRERVWRALTEEAQAWWHPGFFSREGAERYVVEARLGGRLYEDWGDGEGLIWYTVTGLVKNELLHCTGDLDQRHGPGRLYTVFRLEAVPGGTRLRLEECGFGRVSETLRASMVSGWKCLVEGCLKVFVETGARPEPWPDPEPC